MALALQKLLDELDKSLVHALNLPHPLQTFINVYGHNKTTKYDNHWNCFRKSYMGFIKLFYAMRRYMNR